MKFAFIIMLSIFVYVTNVFGKEYKNDQYGIRLNLPDSWEVAEYESLSPKMKTMLERNNPESQTVAVCGMKSADGLSREKLIIQYQKFTKTTAEKAIRLSRQEYGKKMMVTLAKTLAEDAIGQKLNSYRQVDKKSYFEESRNEAYAMVCYQQNDKPDMVAIVSKLIIDGGAFTLQCFSLGKSADKLENIEHSIVESFHYQGGPLTMSEAPKKTSEQISHETGKTFLKTIYKWCVPIMISLTVIGIVKRYWWG